MRRALMIAGVLTVAGCGNSTTGSNPADLCRTVQGVEVCVARSEYRPTDVVQTTVTNTTSESMFIDMCALKPVGKTSQTSAFDDAYSPNFNCGSDVDPAEIVANMVEVAPGATGQVAPMISPFAFQGFYRINVWLLDENGMTTTPGPSYSGTFEVFPSAGM